MPFAFAVPKGTPDKDISTIRASGASRPGRT